MKILKWLGNVITLLLFWLWPKREVEFLGISWNRKEDGNG